MYKSCCTFSLSVNLPRLSVAVLFTVTIPCTRLGCIIANLRFFSGELSVARRYVTPFFYLVMMFAPAPSPNPTTLEEKCFLRASRRNHLNLATLNWSRMVTRPIPIWCMVGKLKSLGRSLAPGSCPGITTCRKTDLVIGDRCFQIVFHLARMSVMLSSFKKVTQFWQIQWGYDHDWRLPMCVY